eukprot:231867-Hanusia_phi.AAC.2
MIGPSTYRVRLAMIIKRSVRRRSSVHDINSESGGSIRGSAALLARRGGCRLPKVRMTRDAGTVLGRSWRTPVMP